MKTTSANATADLFGGSMLIDSLTRKDDRKTKTCGISNGKHFYGTRRMKTIRQDGKKDRRVLVCEWCFEPKGKV